MPCPNLGLQEGASATLAYAFDDSAIATVAASVGDHANAAVFRNRSTAAYKHLWSPKHQLLCPRSVTKGTAPAFFFFFVFGWDEIVSFDLSCDHYVALSCPFLCALEG